MRYFLIILIALFILSCEPEDYKLRLSDYNRAVEFLPGNIQKKIYNLDVRPNWFEDSISFWYKTNTASGTTFYLVHLDSMKKARAFDHKRLADSLKVFFDEKIDDKELEIGEITYALPDSIGFTFRNRTFKLYRNTYKLKEIEDKQENASDKSEIPSPDENWLAYIKEHNLSIKSARSGNVIQLRFDGN